MFTKEKRNYFKRECKSKYFMMKRLNEIENELKYINDILRAKANNYKENMYGEEALLKEKESITLRLNYVDDVISSIRDPRTRGIVNDLWVNGFSKTKTSIKYSLSEMQMYRNIDTALSKIL
ncbi:hypothetical protein ACWG0P_07160 [Amedibacillus sp. YH-ame6]